MTACVIGQAGNMDVAHLPPAGINWFQGDADAAFAQAKASRKPVFLYWGAVWCPPCNQVKATIFNQQAFIQRTRRFIPVYVDGDSPGAQKLGERFKVRGYPTMVLFKPDGSEITRLPGEVDAARYIRTLGLGLASSHPIKQTLAAALRGDKLSETDWRLLADYAWDTDEGKLLPEARLPGTLLSLAQKVPASQIATASRMQLRALAVAATAKSPPPADKQAALSLLKSLLSDPQRCRDNFDVLVNYADNITGFLTGAGTDERLALSSAWNKALQGLAYDSSLSGNDRLNALLAQIALAHLAQPQGKLPEALLKEVRERVAQADQNTSNAYERQSVISTAADILTEAGLLAESDTLLQAELKRSHSPYYFMLGLAANAKLRGEKTQALTWYEQAYQAAQGPATRLQWGVNYLGNLTELAPDDAQRIEAIASQVLAEVNTTPNAFYERSRRALEKLADKLNTWNKGGQHAETVHKVTAQWGDVCAKLPEKDPQRAVCNSLRKILKA